MKALFNKQDLGIIFFLVFLHIFPLIIYMLLYCSNIPSHYSRVPLDTDLLEKFPDIKAKVAKKLEWLGNEQLSVLRTLMSVYIINC